MEVCITTPVLSYDNDNHILHISLIRTLLNHARVVHRLALPLVLLSDKATSTPVWSTGGLVLHTRACLSEASSNEASWSPLSLPPPPCVPTSCCCCCSFVRLLQTQLAVVWCCAPSFSIWVRLQGYYLTWEKLNPMRVPPRPKPCGGVCVCVCACVRVCVYGGDDGRLRLTEISWTRLAGFFLLPDRFVGLCLR